MKTAILLTISNVFMTFAWYGHLKHKDAAIWKAILVSWLIASLEYCFQVPANRIGSNHGFSTSQLKIMQECITLVVFCVFAVFWMGDRLKWNYLVGFGLVLLAVFFVFYDWSPRSNDAPTQAARSISPDSDNLSR